MATTDDSTAPMTDLTAFQRDVLAVVAGTEETLHGLGIKKRLKPLYEGEINHGRLYPNLDDLVEKGLVEKGEIDRRTNSYEITSRGRRELAADHAWRSARLEG